MNCLTRHTRFVLLALLLGLAPAALRAQTPPAQPPPDPQAAAHRAQAKDLEAQYDYAAAIAEYQQAYDLDKTAHPNDAALDLNRIGICYLSISLYPNALDFFQQELAMARQLGDKPREATTLSNIGMVYDALSRYDKALDYFGQALSLDRQAGDKSGEATTLNNIGTVFNYLSRYDKALDFYGQALLIKRQVRDKSGEANTLNNIGEAYRSLSQYDKALDYYQQALPLERQIGDKTHEATTLNNIGLVYHELSRYDKALDFYGQALLIKRQVGDRAGEALTLNNIGMIREALSQYDKALDYLGQALPLERQMGNRAGEAMTLNNIGLVYHELSRYDKALDFYGQALLLERQIGDKSQEVTTLNNIGMIREALSQYDKALDYLGQALPLERHIGDRASEAMTLNNIGLVYHELSRYDKALDFYGQALLLERQIRDRTAEATMLNAAEATMLNNIMLAYKSLKQPHVAIFYGKQSVNAYQVIRRSLAALDKESQKSYLAANQSTYRTLADLLISQGRLTEARQVLRLLKEREFYDYVNPDPNAPPPTMNSVVLTRREAHWTQAYDNAAKPLSNLGAQEQPLRVKKDRTPAEDAQLDGLQTQITAATATLGRVQTQIVRDFSGPRTADDAPPLTTGAEDVQRALPPGTVALYTIVSPDRLDLILLTRTGQKAYSSPVTADALYDKVLALRAALTDPNVDPTAPAAELYRLVLEPVQKDLDAAGTRTILFSLDDALRYIPPAVLYNPLTKQYAAERYQTQLITLAGARPDAPASPRLTVLGLGVSTSQDGAPALPGVRAELTAIVHEPGDSGGLVPGKRLLDGQFTQAALEDGLRAGGYPLVHLASHFALGGNKDTSYLLLGDGGHLSVAELARDPQRFRGVELLTLSACQTAMEVRGSSGREVESVGALAQTLGAGSVLASLWPVSDAATPPLMTALYGYRQQHPSASLSESLQAAQLSLLHKPMPASSDTVHRGTEAVSGGSDSPTLPKFVSDPNAPYAHPFYWAPFILIGNWR